MPHGPVALVGSGEYLPSMLEIERDLIAGRPPRYVQLPTAASREGATRMAYWVDLGKAQAERLGVEAVPLVVTTRDEANDPDVVAQVAGAGLIYLSGGDPGHLADVLRDTALWHAIIDAWTDGAALAGCSAGAMVMAAHIPDFRHPRGDGRPGLGLLPSLQVIPHFDKMAGWIPDFMTRPFLRRRDGITLVGVDEETAIVGGPDEFVVVGHRAAWILGDGRRQRLGPGEKLVL
ncbi:MAG TPA: Type 1 glutamine amidotransferase-like domain-containing protein [Micromonosporaceae bacterium]|jgi:cyanophycinase-like exopeptidase